jgi:hypothetical protein
MKQHRLYVATLIICAFTACVCSGLSKSWWKEVLVNIFSMCDINKYKALVLVCLSIDINNMPEIGFTRRAEVHAWDVIETLTSMSSLPNSSSIINLRAIFGSNLLIIEASMRVQSEIR